MEHLYPKCKDQYGKFTSPYIFRGESRKYSDVASLFYREFLCKTDHKPHEEPQNIELTLIDNFQKYASYIPEYRGFGFWEWMMIARHYELPTRLMDFSSSPLTALYNSTKDVACQDSPEDDGIVWTLNMTIIRESRHFLPASISKILKDKDRKQLTVKMLTELGLDSFEGLEERSGQRPGESVPLIIDPPTLDPRIMHQFGCFLCFSDRKTTFNGWLSKLICSDNADDLLHQVTKNPCKLDHGHNSELKLPLFRIFVIKRNAKREIFDKLHMSNITPRILSPGLEGIAKTLHQRYSIIERK